MQWFPRPKRYAPHLPETILFLHNISDPAIFSCYPSTERYRLQCDVFEAMWLVMKEFIERVCIYQRNVGVKDFQVSFTGPLPLQEYFELIDTHVEVSWINRIGLLHLKSTHPLWKIFEKWTTKECEFSHVPTFCVIRFITDGVNILFRSAKRVNNTLPY